MSWRTRSIGFAVLGLAVFGLHLATTGAIPEEKAVAIPAPATDNPKTAGPAQTAVLAGGCFWGIQGIYQHVQGVTKAVSGYAGGEQATAEYRKVSNGETGHAESVQITFDPKQISYGQILQIYFSVGHDPTQLNRQGPDSGTQYRSNIFYTDEMQMKIADAYIAQLNKAKVFPKTIVTRVDLLKAFYTAEDYHQDFLYLNPTQLYIAEFDIPKLQNLKSTFPSLYRGQPVLVKGSN